MTSPSVKSTDRCLMMLPCSSNYSSLYAFEMVVVLIVVSGVIVVTAVV